MTPEERAKAFEQARPQLVGVAYRLLGSISEADDVVQDIALKWFGNETPEPESPGAWLTKVCTNRCLDILRSARLKRVDYVGSWIPEQFVTETAPDAAQNLEMASSLTTAFLMMLERLTPRERAAYLLRDIFEMSYHEVADALGVNESNCRQLVSRARKMIGQENVRFVPPEEKQRDLLQSFLAALETGTVDGLARMLCEDVDLRADSGGKVKAIRHVLMGVQPVLEFISGTLGPAWSGSDYGIETVNGQLALVVRNGSVVSALVTLGYQSDGAARSIFIQRNPDKLAVIFRQVLKNVGPGGLTFLS